MARGWNPGRRWMAVFLALLGALGALVFLLLPEVLGDARGSRRSSAVAVAAAAVPSPASREVSQKEASAPAPPESHSAELVPYGNRDLPADEGIRGRILDREEKPVPDAIVLAAYKETASQPYELVVAGRVRSEPDGSFVLGPLDRRSYWILAVKEEAGVAHAENQMPGAWVDLVLAPGARLRGRVTVRGAGGPVKGARVVVKDWNFFREAETDDDGRYAFALLPPTVNTWVGHQVVVAADGFKRAERTNLRLRNEQEQVVDFELEKGEALRGKVVDAVSLQPVAGAIVAEGWEPYHKSVATREDGTYRLPDVDPSPNLMFAVRAPNYLPHQRQSDGSGTLDFELDASIALEGRVLDLKDRPVAGARVYLHRIQWAPGFDPGNQNTQQTVTTSDATGVFRFAGVLPGQVAVVAFHKAHAPGEKGPIEIVSGGAPPQRVDVMLKTGLTVQGEVRDLQDRPIPGIQVSLQRGWQGQMMTGYQYLPNYWWMENPVWYSDEKGKFTLSGAVAGKHYLTAWDQTYGWAGTQVEGVEGQRIDGVVISFAGAGISGVFQTAAGEPVPGVWVYANGPKNTQERNSRTTMTDSLGRFKLGGLKEGSYDISAWTTFGQAKPLQDIPAGTINVELRLETTQTLRGEVTSVLSGRALDRFTLMIQPKQEQGGGRKMRSRGGTQWQGEIRAPDGRFEQPVMPGVYTVIVKAPGHAPSITEEVIVEENYPPAEMFLRLDAGGGITGVLTDASGKPIPNHWIQAQVYRAPGEQQTQRDWQLGGTDGTDGKGRFFIEGLAAGTYVIQVNLGNRGAATAQVVVPGRERVEQNLQLLPTGTIVIEAVDEEGNPVANVYFWFFDDRNNWLGWGGQTDAQGRSQSQPIRMGAAAVQAQHQNNEYVTDRFHVTVEANKQRTFRVTMKKVPKPGDEGAGGGDRGG